ncbi:hypothetical protein BGZ65_008660 [Modicella reniformis]|uniref:Uncharacterized protein n=1 Tax=Modicella reniformis TaxID=1440133 RepID=A0A9P6ITW6_9FUNG|nr:hypothetical protein BGZ65_008660 [Modicella reniformis]
MSIQEQDPTWFRFTITFGYEYEQRKEASDKWEEIIKINKTLRREWEEHKRERNAYWRLRKDSESLITWESILNEGDETSSMTMTTRSMTKRRSSFSSDTSSMVVTFKRLKTQTTSLAEPWKTMFDIARRLNKFDRRQFKILKVEDIMAGSPKLTDLQLNLLKVQLVYLERFSKSSLSSDQKEASVALSCTLNMDNIKNTGFFPAKRIRREKNKGLQKYNEIVESLLLEILKTDNGRKDLIEHLPSVEVGYINSQRRRRMSVPTKWREILDVIKDL